MNESLPSSVGSLAASRCLRLISDSALQFAAFENLTFIGFLTCDKSIFRDLCRPEDSPPDLTHALFTLDIPSFLSSVCPSGLDLRPRIAKLHCAAEFAIKLPQHAQKINGPADEGSGDEAKSVDDHDGRPYWPYKNLLLDAHLVHISQDDFVCEISCR